MGLRLEKHGPFRYLTHHVRPRLVCGPEAKRNPSRGNGRRTESTSLFPPLARAIRLVSRPSSMAAAAVSTAASLTLPRRADHARGSSLRRRHCCVRPLAASSSSSSNPARQPTATTSGDSVECSPSPRRQVLVAGAAAAAAFVSRPTPAAFAEGTKGFLGVIDRKAGYSFVYPFGWQEVSVQGQDKVYKDVIEPLESVSINMIPTIKEDIRELGPPDQVAEALVRKVLAPPTQKTKLIEAKQENVSSRTLRSVAHPRACAPPNLSL
ncbi:hypothetical protein ACQ4PT_047609 [Festuca glaucescens]